MKKKDLHHALYRTACAVLAAGVICQTSIPTIFAASGQSDTPSASASAVYSLKDDFSKYGNPVTEYYNQEDQQMKTILWTQGITPPRMDGDNPQFKRQVTEVNGTTFIEYTSPYLPNQGWYDVNKSTNFEQNDANLCFAAAASNSLHWWMDRNSSNIDRYLERNKEDAHIQELTHLRSSFADQQHSGVYNIFRNQFAGKTDGYWSDLLLDQFLNGYYLTGGGTNDSDAARDKLLTNGPDKHGGFFFNAFRTDRLTDRRYYDMGFDAINRELKSLLMSGKLVLMVYDMGSISHIVTLWGAEYDANGNICAVYYTDSDDQASDGMHRYRLVNINGRPAVTTSMDGTYKSPVTCLQILSPGTELWGNYFQDPKTTLDLVWSNTDLVYNGQMQAPTVTASNIALGDDVTLTVEGGAVNAGSYTATVVLSGPSADKYELPTNATQTFEIKKAPAPAITFPTAGGLQYGQKLSDSVLSGGSTEYGQFTWADPSIVPLVNNPGFSVNFVPSEAMKQNYELQTSSAILPVAVSKANPTVTVDAAAADEDGSIAMALTASLTAAGFGKLPSGTVTFTIKDETGSTVIDTISNVAVVDGTASTTLTDVPLGTYTVTASYSGSENYNAVSSAAFRVDLSKQPQTDFQLLPIDAKTYGDAAFPLAVSGGSGSGAVTYVSSDPSVLSISGSTVTIHKAGTAIITATKAGDALHNEASVSVPVVVNKRDVKITANSRLNVMQGDVMPELTYSVDGLVNGDQLTDVKLSVSIENTDVPGDYQIFVQGGQLTNAESYNITYVTGTLSIQAKELPPVPPTPTEPTEPSEPAKPVVPSGPDANSNAAHQNNAGTTSTTPVQPPVASNTSSSESKPATDETTESSVTQPESAEAQDVTQPAEPNLEENHDDATLPDSDAQPENHSSAPDSSTAKPTATKHDTSVTRVVVIAVVSLLILVIIGVAIAYVVWRKKEQNRQKRTKTH